MSATAATARADRLTQAILAKAFIGELVPTEAELVRQQRRDYEPASALLERIRAARAGCRERQQSDDTQQALPTDEKVAQRQENS